MSLKNCTVCTKQVYPVEAVKFSDHVFHKACFRCKTCSLTLNLKNAKMHENLPYCTTHYPTQHSFAVVSDTPDIQRAQKSTAIISQAAYHDKLAKKADQERRRAGIEEAPPVAAKPQRAVGSIADYDPMKHGAAAKPAPAPVAVAAVLPAVPAPVPAPVPVPVATPAPAPVAPSTPSPQPVLVPESTTTSSTPASASGGGGRYGRYGRGGGGGTSTPQNIPVAAQVITAAPDATAVGGTRASLDMSSQQTVASTATSGHPSSSIEACSSGIPQDQADLSARMSSIAIAPAPQAEPQPVAQPPSPPAAHAAAEASAAAPAAEAVAGAAAEHTGPLWHAVFDYESTEEDEIALQVGDIIIDGETIDDGWMYGTNTRTGKRGMLPSNYVELS